MVAAQRAKPRLQAHSWTVVKHISAMAAAPTVAFADKNRINAVVQVHASLRDNMLSPGPLQGKAEVIYTTAIAASATTGRAKAGVNHINELIFLLPHRPDVIRLWVDERPVNDPAASKESIRKGGAEDAKHCSVIKVCIGDSSRAPASKASPPRATDIYLPPSAHNMRVWVYLDPKKNSNPEKSVNPKDANHAKDSKESRSKVTANGLKPPHPDKRERRRTASHAKPPAASPAAIAIPERTTSLNRSPVSPKPKPRKTHSQPKTQAKTGGTTERKRDPAPPRSSARAPAAKPRVKTDSMLNDAVVVEEPDDFKTDIFQDLARVTAGPGSFSHFRSGGIPAPAYPSEDEKYGGIIDYCKKDDYGEKDAADDDSSSEGEDEKRDVVRLTPLEKLFPLLGRKLPIKSDHPLYKAGKRAQSSVFFEEETMPGDRKIEISHVEKPDVWATREFARPSRIRRMRARLSMMMHRRRNL